MSRAADVAEQARAHGVKAAVPLMVTPGSAQIRATIERDGQLRSLNNIGAVVLANACGPCIGQWRRTLKRMTPNTIVTSYNRNFPGRNDGQRTTMNFIASPEIVTAFALAGRLSFNPLTDSLVGADGKPFRLDPPTRARSAGQRFRAGRHGLRAAGVGWENRHAARDIPSSERIQLMEPWPAWDGRDFADMPMLIKTKGKTTTDHISPAGRWLAIAGIWTSSATTCSWARSTRSREKSVRQKIF